MTPGEKTQARFQIVGTYFTGDGSWLWGWDHPSVQPPFAQDAARVRELGRQHGLTHLTERKILCGEGAAWSFTALAGYLAEAAGTTRIRTGPSSIYLTYHDPVMQPLH